MQYRILHSMLFTSESTDKVRKKEELKEIPEVKEKHIKKDELKEDESADKKDRKYYKVF